MLSIKLFNAQHNCGIKILLLRRTWTDRQCGLFMPSRSAGSGKRTPSGTIVHRNPFGSLRIPAQKVWWLSADQRTDYLPCLFRIAKEDPLRAGNIC